MSGYYRVAWSRPGGASGHGSGFDYKSTKAWVDYLNEPERRDQHPPGRKHWVEPCPADEAAEHLEMFSVNSDPPASIPQEAASSVIPTTGKEV